MYIVVTDSGNFREWKQSAVPSVGDRVLVGRGSERVEVVCPGQWSSVDQLWDWMLDIGQRARAEIAAEQREASNRVVRFRAPLAQPSIRPLAAAL